MLQNQTQGLADIYGDRLEVRRGRQDRRHDVEESQRLNAKWCTNAYIIFYMNALVNAPK